MLRYATRNCDVPPDLLKPSFPNVKSSAVGEAQAPVRDLKVPRTDGAWLQRPSAAAAAELVRTNQQALAAVDPEIQGLSLQKLRSWTRDSVWQAAQIYMSRWATPGSEYPTACPWIVGGHQPALFHPGVWAKNFALGGLARQLSGISLNLVVDNDTLASQSIKVPTGTRDNPRVTQIAFDRFQYQQPWEHITVQDREIFESFGTRVAEQLQSWGYRPLIADYWPDVVAGTAATGRVADGFTAARNQWERKWGLENLELPLSHLCRLPAFLWFTAHLLAQLPRFWLVYNSAVRHYREENGIDSTSHPVPELAQKGSDVSGWLESPFWVWRTGDRRRSRLFARQGSHAIELSIDGDELLGELPLTAQGNAQQAVERLQELQASGIHIRTRALTTTLFSRICLADLFVHGIGGSKYDEITDRLISEFCQLPVPGYWTVSGTLQLPLGRHPVSAHDLELNQRRLWDLRWNPTRALAGSAAPDIQAIQDKFDQILHKPASDRPARRQRHKDLSRIKSELRPWTEDLLSSEQARLAEVTRQLAANRILQDREYSYVLYPINKLRDFLTQENQPLKTI